jgi:hypothetical protein
MRSVQDTIFVSINFTAMQNVVENDIMAAVENWQLQVLDIQEPCSVECKNRVALATEDGVTAMVYFATLKDEVVNQIINAIKGKSYYNNLEERSKGHSTDWYHGERTSGRWRRPRLS